MEVILAGYNIDAEVLAKLGRSSSSRGQGDEIARNLTPETIAAAYARISRSTKRVDELRRDARREIEAARRSNSRIVFGMGHGSIAEHAVFNIDIIGVSRFLVEYIQSFRLCSFTEKSQRYVTLKGDFVLPREIRGTPWEQEFQEVIASQNEFYFAAERVIVPHLWEKHREMADTPAGRTRLDGWAKEDARYALSLATQSQMGMTLNARNLELMLRRLHALPLEEAKEFAAKLLAVTQKIAPSLLRYTTATEYDEETRHALTAALGTATAGAGVLDKKAPLVRLLLEGPVQNPTDDNLLAAVLFSSSQCGLDECRRRVGFMSKGEKRRVFATMFARMRPFDPPLRELEVLPLAFEAIVSATCFAQLKRHRMTSIHRQPYDPALGVTVPPTIAAVGLRQRFLAVIKKSAALHQRLADAHPAVAPYILTNAHRRRLLISLNARELYHISRLRLDEHAQWDIRAVVGAMVRQAKRLLPLTMLMAGGKDAFPALQKLPGKLLK